MKRRLPNLLTALSLLLCVAACSMWARTYFVEDRLSHNRGDRLYVAYSESATLYLGFVNEPGGPIIGWRWDTRRSYRDFEPDDLRPTPRWRVRPRDAWVMLPYPLLCLLTGLAPAWRATSRTAAATRRRRARRRGLCPSCGYDLRATPGRCPECGATADAPAGEV